MSGGGNEAVGVWDDSVHHGMDKLDGQQCACQGKWRGGTNDKNVATEIQSHTLRVGCMGSNLCNATY